MLYLLHDAFSRNRTNFVQETKLQKLVFLSEWSMIGERNKGFNFRFIKLVHGPFSQELETDVAKLVKVGLVSNHGLEPTERADMIIEDFRDVIERNGSFTKYVNGTNDDFAGVSLKELLDVIYAMSWGKGKTIRDLPPRTPMLYPMKEQSVASEFSITDEEAEDLLMNFDPRAVSALLQATEEMRTGKMRSDEHTAVALSK
ncbi:hypothetical protein D4R54_00920 [archaeon]|nr:MAG: hypothetical protein D4R54_00920 [archaeon]